jgi:AcrR family transcriptional regulator
MSDQTNRRYHSPRRLQQAEATRQAIMRAARKLFAEHGYQATTLQAIAQEAEVSVPTLYVVFGSKVAILLALVKSAGVDEDIRTLAQDAFDEPDPERQLRLAAKVMRTIHERDADIINLLWQAGEGDPDLAAAWSQIHHQRFARLSELMRVLARKDALNSTLSAEAATETLWALSSPEMFRLLVREREWTIQRFEDWLAETSIALLLRPTE